MSSYIQISAADLFNRAIEAEIALDEDEAADNEAEARRVNGLVDAAFAERYFGLWRVYGSRSAAANALLDQELQIWPAARLARGRARCVARRLRILAFYAIRGSADGLVRITGEDLQMLHRWTAERGATCSND